MKYLIHLRSEEERRILFAITNGLSILRSEQGLVWIDQEINSCDKYRSIEDKISRALFRCLKLSQNNLREMGLGLMGILHPQLPIPPNPNVSFEEHEGNIPDFSWQIFDNALINKHVSQGEISHLPLDYYFHIECKRLGSPTSPKWKLNKNYVKNGIVRFVSEEHRYGQHSGSGAMIGYIEDLPSVEILKQVNAEIEQIKQTLHSKIKISLLSLSTNGWQDKSTSHLCHQLERSFPISPFTLWHFWLDLRDCYPRK